MANEKELHKASQATNGKQDRKVGGMSCAECRRSKLKCDRTFPCSACVRRGCANICPSGTLQATKGNKVLQNQNETLLQAVKRLTVRVRELETALKDTQSQVSPQPHPLLQDGERLSDIIDASAYEEAAESPKSDLEEATEGVGSLIIGDQGQSRFHGQSSASEFLQTLLPGNEEESTQSLQSENMYKFGFARAIIELINAFPFNAVETDRNTVALVLSYLPDHAKAFQLALVYFEHAGCIFSVIQQEDFVPRLLRTLRAISEGATIGDVFHAHEIACIYLVLAIGSHFSGEPNGREMGEKFYLLGCAAMSLTPLVKEATSTTIQGLFVMVQYFNCIDSPSCERRWLLSSVMFRLAYTIGLQRDPALWNLSPEETQRRRTLFWELYMWDAWNSIICGRPPSFNINFTDCRFPEDRSDIRNAKGEREMGFDAYKYRFAAFILAPVVNHVFGVRQMDYSALLELDIRLRKLPPPSWLLAPIRGKGEPVDGRSWSSNSTQAMQQYCMVCTRESTLLYIHRRYFSAAIKLNDEDPLQTKYGPSVMAVTRSACLILSSLRGLYGAHPDLASKQPFFWSGAFSSIMVLSCLVYNCPGCPLACDAMTAINDGVELYSMQLFEDSPSSVKLLSTVRDSVYGMFNKFQAHAREGRGRFKVTHDYECATMRVLEGSTVLVNVHDLQMQEHNGYRPSSSSSSSSPPSYSSGSPDGMQKHSLPQSNERQESHTNNVSRPPPDLQMVDLNGVYYPGFAPPSGISQLTTSTQYSNVSLHPDNQYLPGPSSQTTDHFNAQVPPQSTQSNQSAHSASQSYGYQSLNNYGALSVQDTVMPPYGAQGMQYEPLPGQAELYALQQGAFGTGMGMDNMYDPVSWERVMAEMGSTSTNGRVNGGSAGSFAGPSTA